jgi:hypothetical protein
VLAGATTVLFATFADIMAGFAGFVHGGLTGRLAGQLGGLICHSIVRPARPLMEENIYVF